MLRFVTAFPQRTLFVVAGGWARALFYLKESRPQKDNPKGPWSRSKFLD